MCQCFTSFYCWITFHFVDVLNDSSVLVVSTVCYWLMLPWIFMYTFLCGRMFSFLWGIFEGGHNLGVELLGRVVILCLTFWGTTRLFSKVAAPFYILIGRVGGFLSPRILLNAWCNCLFHCATLTGVKWWLNMILIWVSVMANGVECLFLCLLAISISSLEKCLLRSFVNL